MDKAHLLLVEDEPHLARVVKDSLEQSGYQVTHVADGKKAYSVFQNQYFDLCILDVMLPSTDGFTLAKQIRAYNPTIPILFLTARVGTPDIIEGYKSGGNDYLKKPFSLDELFLRIKELLKRKIDAVIPSTLKVGKFSFDPQKQELEFDGRSTKLSYRETQLLTLLCQHKNALLDRKLVLLSLWGEDNAFHTRTMDVFITRLRKLLKADPAVEILNLRGLGFKLIC